MRERRGSREEGRSEHVGKEGKQPLEEEVRGEKRRE